MLDYLTAFILFLPKGVIDRFILVEANQRIKGPTL